MRGLTLHVAVAFTLALAPAGLAIAQTAPPAASSPTAAPVSPPAAAPEPPPVPADPVLARVGTNEIHASDVAEATQSLPEELRGMPPQVLYPLLLDQLIDREAIAIEARKRGLQNDPAVVKQVSRATETAMQNALLTREIAPTLTDQAIEARYKRDYADKPGEEEVHAAHILVADEDKARAIIAQLKAGADFAQIAKETSTDPSAKGTGGDLGYFKKTDMLPEFAAAAFALKPGEITEAPVKTRFGWHVIKLLDRRTAPPPALDQVRDEIRQTLIQEGVTRVLATAKQGLEIQKFNQDGTPQAAAPAPDPAPAPTPAPTPAK